MYCRYCGTELPDDSEFCTNCGKKVNTDIKGEKIDTTEKTRTIRIITIAIFLVIILVVAILIILLGKDKTKNSKDSNSEVNNTAISNDDSINSENDETGVENESTDDLERVEEIELLPTDSDFTKVQVGDVVTFGQYDYNIRRGVEPVEWEVRAVEGDKVLLVSKYLIGHKCFDDFIESSIYIFGINHEYNWESSDLREYLNTVVLNQMFNAAELKYIINSDITTESSANYYLNYLPEELGRTYAKKTGVDESSPSVKTNDRLFLLSFEDLAEYYDMEIDSKGTPTFLDATNIAGKGKVFYYYLRNHGGSQDQMFCLSPETGHISERDHTNGVRPAMWVSIEDVNDISDIDLEYTEKDFSKKKLVEAGYAAGDGENNEIDISFFFEYRRDELKVGDITCFYACDGGYFDIYGMLEDCGLSGVTQEHGDQIINSFADMYDSNIDSCYEEIEEIYLELCGIYAENGKLMKKSDYIDVTDRMPQTLTANIAGEDEALHIKKIIAGVTRASKTDYETRPVYKDDSDFRVADCIEFLFITESDNKEKIANYFNDVIYGDKYIASPLDSVHVGRSVKAPPQIVEETLVEVEPKVDNSKKENSSGSIIGTWYSTSDATVITFDAGGNYTSNNPNTGEHTALPYYHAGGNRYTVYCEDYYDFDYYLKGDTLAGEEGSYVRQ